MLGPGLKVAGAGLDNGTWVEAMRREPRKRGLVEIVEGGETMLTRWTNVDVRAVGIAVLEQRKPFEDRRGRNAVESRKHSTLTQDTDIVEGCLDSSEHDANRGFGLVHRCLLPDASWVGRGAEEGKAPPPAFAWASLGIYHLSEIRGAVFDTMAHFFCEEKGLQAQPLGLERLASKRRIFLPRCVCSVARLTYVRPRRGSSQKLPMCGIKR